MSLPERRGQEKDLALPRRLSVLLARDAPIGVVFQRGPSPWVRITCWQTDTDAFEPGQWFHGRIYPEYSDLSPDGRHLLYLANKETRRASESDVGRNWTAISRPPYLTALVLWPEIGRPNAGGVFADDSTVILRSEPSPHPRFPLPPQLRVTPPSEVAIMPGEGLGPSAWSRWTRRRYDECGKYDKDGKFQSWGWYLHVGQREDATSRYTLTETIQRARLGVAASESLTLTDYAALTETPLPEGATWADFDQRGRLVWAKDGCLWTIPLLENLSPFSFNDAIKLADFNAAQPEPLETPEWAKQW